jgi:hypothetical protein
MRRLFRKLFRDEREPFADCGAGGAVRTERADPGMKRFFRRLRSLVLLAGIAFAAWYGLRARSSPRPADNPAILAELPADTAVPAVRHPLEGEYFDTAVARAWRYVDDGWEPGTGFVRTVTDYPVATVWDIGSGLAALFSAHELGLLPSAEYDRRIETLLTTLRTIPLFDGAAFNKTYGTPSGRMLGRDDSPSPRGFGWSALDLGRLLIWLRIIADHEPRYAADAAEIVDRMDMDRLLEDGLLRGEDLDSRGRTRRYPEGTLAYEQYAARGFALWGKDADLALSFTAHSEPLRLWDATVLIDRRPRSCLTSDPLVLLGLELGWSDAARRLALGVLAAQEARYQRTGQVTIASEDASAVPPHHFYYYCLHGDGLPFRIMTAGHLPLPDGPRTVSAKAALAWYALVPNEYTALALDHVVSAWGEQPDIIAGVEEESGLAVGPPNVNTAAVILESAAYLRRGRPLIEGVRPSN